MLIDEATITVAGGRGGDGLVSFYSGKNGPSGGDGGKGGDVYVEVNPSITNLNRFVQKKEFIAQQGEKGRQNKQEGKYGEDLILQVPVGTSIIDLDTQETVELTEKNQRVLLATGGLGGKGNQKFATSTHQTPRHADPGEESKTRNLKLIMRYIAQYGFIGHPNAGKSSLLNELTAAKAKTANYAFTTLEPNLGALEGKIIADIPGLIEGASSGKGLGTRFLKHIEKVELLFHCISSESTDLEKDYQVVRKELEQFNPELVQKKEIILLTKIDLISPSEVKEKIGLLRKCNSEVYPISIHDYDGLQKLKKLITG